MGQMNEDEMARAVQRGIRQEYERRSKIGCVGCLGVLIGGFAAGLVSILPIWRGEPSGGVMLIVAFAVTGLAIALLMRALKL